MLKKIFFSCRVQNNTSVIHIPLPHFGRILGTVCSTSQLLKEEEDCLHNALRRCKYPLWAWNRVNINKNQKKKNKGNNTNKNNNSNNINKPYIVVCYMKGLGESCKNICRKHGVEVYFRGGITIRDLMVHPKDKDTIL